MSSIYQGQDFYIIYKFIIRVIIPIMLFYLANYINPPIYAIIPAVPNIVFTANDMIARCIILCITTY